uniref:Uncharacterized protein n=1 Tax=Meloidogyne enterolobii TaxID=390850 RepID=A0A6V7UZZ7_MELEN|nr:unnamed protein product [Meloidogyne enterolobii]
MHTRSILSTSVYNPHITHFLFPFKELYLMVIYQDWQLFEVINRRNTYIYFLNYYHNNRANNSKYFSFFS